jgi:hypothetical protein
LELVEDPAVFPRRRGEICHDKKVRYMTAFSKTMTTFPCDFERNSEVWRRSNQKSCHELIGQHERKQHE